MAFIGLERRVRAFLQSREQILTIVAHEVVVFIFIDWVRHELDVGDLSQVSHAGQSLGLKTLRERKEEVDEAIPSCVSHLSASARYARFNELFSPGEKEKLRRTF